MFGIVSRYLFIELLIQCNFYHTECMNNPELSSTDSLTQLAIYPGVCLGQCGFYFAFSFVSWRIDIMTHSDILEKLSLPVLLELQQNS